MHSDLGVFRAKYVIVATSVSVHTTLLCLPCLSNLIIIIKPLLAGSISYDPPLPHTRDHLTQRTPMGCVIKVRTTTLTTLSLSSPL